MQFRMFRREILFAFFDRGYRNKSNTSSERVNSCSFFASGIIFDASDSTNWINRRASRFNAS